jgi:hypothetical protein
MIIFKKTLKLILISNFIIQFSFAQTIPPDNNTKDTSEQSTTPNPKIDENKSDDLNKDKMLNDLDQIKAELKKLSSKFYDDTTHNCVGSIAIRKKTVNIYGHNDKSEGQTNISKVKIDHDNGQLHITAYGDSETFESTWPISLNTLSTNQKLKLCIQGKNEDENEKYIRVQELLTYDRKKSYIPKSFVDSILIWNDKAGESKTLNFYTSGNVDNQVELRIYSDLLALFGDESNGLIQTEINPRFRLTNKCKPNTNIILFYNVSFPVTLRKFDSKYGKFYFNTTTPTTYSRMSYIQEATYTAGLDVNLIKWGNQPFGRGQFFLDFVCGTGGFKTFNVQRSETLDSTGNIIVNTDTTFNKYANYEEYGFSISGFFRATDKVQFAISSAYLWNQVNEDLITNDDVFTYFRFVGQLSFSLKDSEEYYGTPKLFIRAIYNTAHRSDQSFGQLQVGYSTSIQTLFNK